MKINKEMRDAILFMSIGDGYVSCQGRLSILHCAKQKDYLEWKKNILDNLKIKTCDIKYKNNNGYDSYFFITKTYGIIKKYRKLLYNPKKNISNRSFLDKLTPLGLAIWYMDDGGLSQKKRNGKIHANDLMLNTHLLKEENQIIIDYFKEVWNINFTQVLNRGLYRLRCGTKEARKFLEIVHPYVCEVESMKHKLLIKK